MKKNAFTLIELLAVIVILAIIALIAVPIVLNIINDSKKNSDEQSLELYRDAVQKGIAKYQMNHPGFNSSECDINNDGDIKCNNIIIPVEMKGTKPSEGIIKIHNNKIKLNNVTLNGKKYFPFAILVSDADNNNEVSIGDKYTYQVNDIDTFNFYVLSIEDDKVNLIMDRNICNDGTIEYTSLNNYCRYKWYAEEDNNRYGPTTAMQELYEGTKDWNNVPDMIMSYTDENNQNNSEYGYTSIVTNNKVTTITGKPTTNTATLGTNTKPLKSRLPMQKEFTALCPGKYGACPVWLMEHVRYYGYPEGKYSINNNNEAYQNFFGYWLLDTVRNKDDKSKAIFYYARINSEDATTCAKYGIRPVITVPISDLSN